MTFMQSVLQRHYPIPGSCIEIIVDLLIHPNPLLRKVGDQANFRWHDPPRRLIF